MPIRWGMFRDDLVLDFANDCDTLFAALPYTYVVTAGARSAAKEDALYAQGRTTPGPIVTWAKPGDSAHLYGLAIDVVLQTDTGTSYDTTQPGWVALVAAVRASPHLHSGADFPASESDWPHIERLNWRSFIGN
jgi:hypothetical protein